VDRRQRASRLAARIVPPASVTGTTYGLIITGALLAAESGHHEGYADTIASAVLATALSWLAHAYAAALAERFESGERLRFAAVRDAVVHDLPILRGLMIPVLVLLVAWGAGGRLEHAVTAAVWSTVAALLALELAAGIGSRAGPRELAVDATVGAGMGLGVLALKALLH